MTNAEFVDAVAKKGNFIFCLSWFEQYFTSDVSDEEIGIIMRAVRKYCETGETIDLNDRGLNVILKTICIGIWKTTESYIETCDRRRQAGSKGGTKKAENQRGQNNHIETTFIQDDEVSDEQFSEHFARLRYDALLNP